MTDYMLEETLWKHFPKLEQRPEPSRHYESTPVNVARSSKRSISICIAASAVLFMHTEFLRNLSMGKAVQRLLFSDAAIRESLPAKHLKEAIPEVLELLFEPLVQKHCDCDFVGR